MKFACWSHIQHYPTFLTFLTHSMVCTNKSFKTIRTIQQIPKKTLTVLNNLAELELLLCTQTILYVVVCVEWWWLPTIPSCVPTMLFMIPPGHGREGRSW